MAAEPGGQPPAPDAWPDVPESSRFGGAARPDTPQPSGAGAGPDADALLTAANAARARTDWKEAEALCTRVLRLEPNNADAHVLLGDVCAAQGRNSESSRWYDLALELDPDQPDLKRKAAAARLAMAATAYANPPSRGGQPARWLIWLLGATAVVLGSALVALAILWARGRPEPPGPSTSTQAPPAVVTLVPSVVSPSMPPPSAPPAPSTPAPVDRTPAAPASSVGEQYLQERVAQGLASEGAHDIEVTSVQIDPRTHFATVTIGRRGIGRPDPAVLNQDFKQVRAWVLAQAPDIQQLTVRELARVRMRPDQPPSSQLVAITEATRPETVAASPVPAPPAAATAPSAPQPTTSAPSSSAGALQPPPAAGTNVPPPTGSTPAAGGSAGSTSAEHPPASSEQWLNPDLYPTPAVRP